MKRVPTLVLAVMVGTRGLVAAGESAPVACGAAGIEVIVGLAYDHNALGKVAAAHLELDYHPPLHLPGGEASGQMGERLTGLLPSEYRVTLAKSGKPERVRVALTTTEAGIPPRDVFRFRFDCAAGTQAKPTDLTCATGEVVDASGLPMAPELARKVTCFVAGMAAAASETR